MISAQPGNPIQHLPVHDRSTGESPAKTGREPSANSVTPAPKPKLGRVLVMDDEAPILELTARLLGSRGYEVETAMDGDRAVLLYRTAMDEGRPFAAVILDLTVPEKMGGYEAFKAIRAFDPGVKAIVSSGYSHEPVVLNYKDYGIAGVAPKPYRVSELLGAVEGAWLGK
jgi:CheY-like chemotaxis protein